MVPLAIPDFVVSFGWASLSTAVAGFRGAVLVMTLAVYPLVYLPVAASLRNADPAQEEVARSLGAGRLRTFWRVTVGQARVAILGGCLLVVLVLLAEYGAFEILGYQTFTTEIFTEFSVAVRHPGRLRAVPGAGRPRPGRAGRRGRWPAAAAGSAGPGRWPSGPPRVTTSAAGPCPPLAGLGALVAPGARRAGRLGHLLVGHRHQPAVHRRLRCSSAAGTPSATAPPPPRSPPSWRCRSPSSPSATTAGSRRLLERSTYLVLAMPGLVIALSLAYFSETYADGLWYQTAPMLVVAYAIMFFPLALVGVRASVAQAPPGLEDIARSLGQRRLAVLWRVTRPLVAPGLAAAFCLVFLSAVTELTATLILVPTGVQTLATQFWNYQQNLAYGQAAPFALAMIAIAAVPSYVLGRFFDRLPARSAQPSSSLPGSSPGSGDDLDSVITRARSAAAGPDRPV